MNTSKAENTSSSFRFSGLQVLGILALVMVLSIGLTAWWLNSNIYAAPFSPTQLTPSEQHVLDKKILQLTEETSPPKASESRETNHSGRTGSGTTDEPLAPDPYTENDAKREIQLTEKELNALIAKDPETAKYVAVDLADNLVSLKVLIPVDPEFPILGGKTLRVHTGIMLKYENGRPVVAIRGVSLGGIPIPKSWWGDIKNINLVEEFSSTDGVWDQFSKGVDHINIEEGQLYVKLKE